MPINMYASIIEDYKFNQSFKRLTIGSLSLRRKLFVCFVITLVIYRVITVKMIIKFNTII